VSRNDVIIGVAALVLVVFSLVVSIVIPRRDAGFPGRNLAAFVVVAALLVVCMLGAVLLFGESAHGKEESESPREEAAGAGGGTSAEGDVAAGKEVFDSAGCASCHTLSQAGATGTVGPNLNESTINLEGAIAQITDGGGGMPPFGSQLSQEQIRDVAAFVVSSEGG
jgi:mono/diheme cytochrome c family protein